MLKQWTACTSISGLIAFWSVSTALRTDREPAPSPLYTLTHDMVTIVVTRWCRLWQYCLNTPGLTPWSITLRMPGALVLTGKKSFQCTILLRLCAQERISERSHIARWSGKHAAISARIVAPKTSEALVIQDPPLTIRVFQVGHHKVCDDGSKKAATII